jgi:polyhydroxyalkanoate synthesis regulator phasin
MGDEMAAAKKGATRKTSTSSAKRDSERSRASAGRGDKSVEAFRNALERSLVLSRDRLQEAVDDAVKRGRMTQTDANELVSRLVTRGRQQTDDLMKELERLLDQARNEVETRVAPVRKRAERAARRGARRGRDVVEPALAEADKLRRRAGVGSAPISGYERLSATQVRARLKDLKPSELRKIRTQEQAGKARKSVLSDIDKRLAKK